MQTVLAKGAGQGDPRDIEWLLDRNPLRHIGAEISNAEQALLKARTTDADRLAKRSAAVTWAAMSSQVSGVPSLHTALGLMV